MKNLLLVIATFFSVAAMSAPALANGDGEELFKKKCKSCHTYKDASKHGMGPSLFGVMGRKAGTVSGYKRFSDGMKASGVVWDDASMDGLMANSTKFVEGGNMKGIKIKDAGDREKIIAYIKTLK
ncbi:MAG: c-type cytochrome [Rhodospirillaceae bacterium]|nr:c-type cytochrome [Rhodospirillaceae bacterium]